MYGVLGPSSLPVLPSTDFPIPLSTSFPQLSSGETPRLPPLRQSDDPSSRPRLQDRHVVRSPTCVSSTQWIFGLLTRPGLLNS